MAKGPGPAMQKKMSVLLLLFVAVAFAGLVGRLVYLQLIHSDFFEQQAVEQQLRDITVAPKRGTIYDCNMKALAQSATVWSVYVSPAYITSDAERGQIADALAKILSLSRADVLNTISKRSAYVIVKRKIEKADADLVRQYIAQTKLNCIGLVEDSKRYYPYGSFASQVLGFTGLDNQGLAGIEAQYDNVLKGVPGRVVTAKNAKGTDMPFNFSGYVAPQDGTSLVLTIDEVVQHYLEKHLQDALVSNNVGNKVTGIVMNVKTGAVLAMATEPGFDPNDPFTLSAADQAKLKSLTGDALTKEKNQLLQSMWRNKAISDPYEPGSTFKVVTASAALQTGVVKADTRFFDPGYMIVGGRRIKCWKAGGHGSETFLDGIKNSCNPVFMTIASWMGASNFYKYFQGFGLTEKTGIDLPGEAGTTGLYHTEKDLGPVQLAVSSFGQTFKVTPIQLVTAMCAAVNGGKLVQPHVVEKEIDSSGKIVKNFGTTVKRQVITAEISQEISGMLQQVVSSGTGKNAYVAGYRVGGKTGTSQKIDIDGGKSLRISSFMGFAPADDPEVAVLILFDEPHAANNYGGVIAAPVEGQIFADILPYLGVQPKYTAEELKNLAVTAPDLTGKSVADATRLLANAGLKIRTVGGGATVRSQVPAAGQSIPPGGTVIADTGAEAVGATVTVPDVTGKPPNIVNQLLAQAGLNLQMQGDTAGTNVTSYSQSPAAGEKVQPGTVVTVSFRDNTLDVD